MRARILSMALGLGAMGLLASCDIGAALSETLNVFSVKFSSANPAYTGPTVGGPNWAVSAANLLLPLSLGGLTKEQVLGQYTLDLTFNVEADNSQNSHRAAFGSESIKPKLNLRISERSAAPIVTPIEPFSVEAGQVTNYPFTVKIPLTSVTDKAVLNSILTGNSIPYFLSGSLDFKLLDGLNISGSGVSDVDLTTGAIPTRPTGDLDLGKLASSLL